MATPKKSLKDSLQKASGKPVSEPIVPQAISPEAQPGTSMSKLPPSRQGKKAITGYFDPLVAKQLKRLALEHDRTVQDCLGEALNDLFEKYGENPLA